MFLKKTPNKSGRINLAIVDGYYDKATKKTKHKVIESLGYLYELEKQYDDPIDYLCMDHGTYRSTFLNLFRSLNNLQNT